MGNPKEGKRVGDGLEHDPMFLQLVKLTTNFEVMMNEMKNLTKFSEQTNEYLAKESERSRALSDRLTESMGRIELLGSEVKNADKRIDEHIGSHWKWATWIVAATGTTVGVVKAVWGKLGH